MYELSNGGSRGITLRSVWVEYRMTRKLKESTIEVYDYHIHHYLKDWLDIQIGTIDKTMVRAKHKELSERNGVGEPGGSTANLAMKVLGYMLTYAAAVYEIKSIEKNPIEILNVTRAWNPSPPRTRRLEIDQLPQFFKGVSGMRSHTLRDLLIFILLTGMRVKSARTLKWEFIDFERKVLTVPALHMKNNIDFGLPLSEQLCSLLERRRRYDKVYIFGGREHGTAHNSPGGRRRASAVTKIEWGAHDLRRTFINIALDRVMLEHDIVKRIASHKVSFDITSIYGGNVTERLRGPMQRMSDFILDAGKFDITLMQPKADFG